MNDTPKSLSETINDLASILLIFADNARDSGDDFYSSEMRMVSKLMTAAVVEFEDSKPF